MKCLVWVYPQVVSVCLPSHRTHKGWSGCPSRSGVCVLPGGWSSCAAWAPVMWKRTDVWGPASKRRPASAGAVHIVMLTLKRRSLQTSCITLHLSILLIKTMRRSLTAASSVNCSRLRLISCRELRVKLRESRGAKCISASKLNQRLICSNTSQHISLLVSLVILQQL